MNLPTGIFIAILLGFAFLFFVGRHENEATSTLKYLVVTAACVIGTLWLLYIGSDQGMLMALIAVCIGAPLVSNEFFGWPPLPFSRRLIKSHEDDVTVATFSANVEMEELRGKVGKVMSPLRPSGIADFDGRRVDVITPGMMLEIGTYVRCIDVKAGRVLVSPVEKPSTNDLERADFS